MQQVNAVKVEMETDLTGSENDGGQLGAVPPLCQEGEGERLEEDGWDQAVPLSLWHRSSWPSFNVCSPISQFGSLQLPRQAIIYILEECQLFWRKNFIHMSHTLIMTGYNVTKKRLVKRRLDIFKVYVKSYSIIISQI